MSLRWAELYRQRWDWARDTYNDFRRDLTPEMKAFFPEGRRDVSIVLYGPSQSGKTTLLLRLLGVCPGKMTEVEQVLRAGRPAGTSATTVATRYHWSEYSDGWELLNPRAGRSVVISGETIAARLSQLRSDIEQGREPLDDDPLVIGIPHRYRALSHDAWPHILDLPGSLPVNNVEHAHVVRVAQRHVVRAHVVILVASADDPTSLRPSSLLDVVPALAIWPHQPERFRIVLTRTISNASIGTWVEEGRDVTPDTLRQRVLEALGIDLFGSEAAYIGYEDWAARLFPVEYGQSWAHLFKERPDIWALAEPAVTKLMEQLLAGLSGDNNEETQLLAALRAPDIVAAAVRRRQSSRHTRLENAIRRRDIRERRFKRACDGAEESERQRLSIAIRLIVAHRAAENASGLTVGIRAPVGGEPSTGEQARALNAATRGALVKATEAAWLGWAGSLDTQTHLGRDARRLIDSGAVRAVTTKRFDKDLECCGECDSRPWKQWLPPFRKEPSHCWDLHVKQTPRIATRLDAWLQRRAAALVAEVVSKTEKELTNARARCAQSQKTLSESGRRLERRRDEVRELEVRSRHEDIADEGWSNSANLLRAQLEESWRDQHRFLWEALGSAKPGEDEQRWLTIAILQSLRVREQLIPTRLNKESPDGR
jgi:hypothetical protein